METALSTLRLMPFSKQQVELFASQINESLTNGDVDPLELAIYFKSLEKVIENCKSTLSDLALTEAMKHGKSFEFKGAKIDIKELGTKYDYTNTGDPYYIKYSNEVKEVGEKVKARETFLKSLTDKFVMVDEETGETHEIFPPLKKSTTGITISLK